MGDMADYYADWGILEDLPWDDHPANSTICRYCGEACQWGEHKGKWRLFEQDGTLHECQEYWEYETK